MIIDPAPVDGVDDMFLGDGQALDGTVFNQPTFSMIISEADPGADDVLDVWCCIIGSLRTFALGTQEGVSRPAVQRHRHFPSRKRGLRFLASGGACRYSIIPSFASTDFCIHGKILLELVLRCCPLIARHSDGAAETLKVCFPFREKKNENRDSERGGIGFGGNDIVRWPGRRYRGHGRGRWTIQNAGNSPQGS
jgi:hypothetical protein